MVSLLARWSEWPHHPFRPRHLRVTTRSFRRGPPVSQRAGPRWVRPFDPAVDASDGAGRRRRDREARRRLITATARSLAEREGWEAVTTRRLSTEIENSQPVLYKHVASMEDIVGAVALEGFGELADTLSTARRDAGAVEDELSRVANAYRRFATNPAVYDAMFTQATRLRLATEDTPVELSAAFAQLRETVTGVAGRRDTDTLTEVLWAALHGLTTLGRDPPAAQATTPSAWSSWSLSSTTPASTSRENATSQAETPAAGVPHRGVYGCRVGW
jgi:AcrR family transcriptional regulator